MILFISKDFVVFAAHFLRHKTDVHPRHLYVFICSVILSLINVLFLMTSRILSAIGLHPSLVHSASSTVFAILSF